MLRKGLAEGVAAAAPFAASFLNARSAGIKKIKEANVFTPCFCHIDICLMSGPEVAGQPLRVAYNLLSLLN